MLDFKAAGVSPTSSIKNSHCRSVISSRHLHELTTFFKSKYDDQADSTAQALAWIKESQRTMMFSYDMGWELSNAIDCLGLDPDPKISNYKLMRILTSANLNAGDASLAVLAFFKAAI